MDKSPMKDVDAGNLKGRKMKRKKYSVCVFYFDGYSEPGHYPVVGWEPGRRLISYWAEYCPGRKAGDEASESYVEFGGNWSNVADWVVDHEPSEEEVLAHIKRIRG